MSGQQIGTVVGGIIGAYFGAGNPAAIQLGMAIGGMIGGAVDPTHINGPKIGDGQQQTATDGAPIAWVQGSAMIAGTICHVGPRIQVRHKDNGKGGPVTVTFSAQQSFAILVCESCELRDSTISQILMVLQDGKIVYDVRPGSTMLADSYKWKSNVDFLYGDEDQLPHPTLEAISGSGNTPAYRGSCVAVFKNFDVSQAGDRIPTFQFVVASSAAVADAAIDYTSDGWKYRVEAPGSLADYSGTEYHDGTWLSGPGAFSTDPPSVSYSIGTLVGADALGLSIWSRRQIDTVPGHAVTVTFYHDDLGECWWNGEKVFTSTGGYGADVITIDASKVRETNLLAIKATEGYPAGSGNSCFVGATVSYKVLAAGPPTPVALSVIVRRIALRGGLIDGDIDVSAFEDVEVLGYPIARQANAADCLLPLLQAYFAYGTEYDSKLHFAFYGADASVVIDRADLVEGNDANDGAIISDLRNQTTEFPRRVVGSYMDPSQNYTVVNVAAERLATDVIAIGDQSFQIPVVGSADFATKAVSKALKVAYATLEGTLEYSTPFAGSGAYISLVAGAPLQFQGKRYVLDGLTLGNGNLKLSTRYDRQSAYTSNVQAILGNAPTPPESPYSGPTTLYPMNLPSQRPQDSVGVYLVAASTDGRSSWRGCNVQVSYDGMETWQNALQINMEGTIGTVALAEPSGGEPLTVDVVKYDLDSATSAQLAALANAFAIISSADVTQLGQFSTATETATDKQYELTGVTRSLGGTAAFEVSADDRFTLMDAAYFLPIDPSFAGRTLYFRGVGFGEVAEDATVYPLVYTALVQATGQQRIAEDGTPRIAEDGFNLRFTEN